MKKSEQLNWFTRIFLLLWCMVLVLMIATDVFEPFKDDGLAFMTGVGVAILVVSYIAGEIIDRWRG